MINKFALYAPKNTVIHVDGIIDTVKYRILYHLENGTDKCVLKTSGNHIFEHIIEPGTGPFGVPGDFEIYENAGYISLITRRLMPSANYIRDDSIAILLP